MTGIHGSRKYIPAYKHLVWLDIVNVVCDSSSEYAVSMPTTSV